MRPVIRMHACDYDRSAAHGAQWQELELIFGRLLQHGNIRERRDGSSVCVTQTSGNVHACVSQTHGSCMSPCTKMRKQSSADCCRRSKVFMTRMLSLLPYGINTQNAVCATYIYANTDWRIFCTRKRSHACVSYRKMKSVLLRWTPSLNDHSKLKGQYTDVKSVSSISVWPSLKPHKILVTLSL